MINFPNAFLLIADDYHDFEPFERLMKISRTPVTCTELEQTDNGRYQMVVYTGKSVPDTALLPTINI